MTPDSLQRRLDLLAAERPALEPLVDLPPDHPSWRAALVALAEAHPGDGEVRNLLLDLHDWLGAAEGLPDLIAGTARESLVRADAWTVTFLGRRIRTGRATLVRTLRAHGRRDPLLRAQLRREGEALVAAGLPITQDEEDAALVVELLHPPFEDAGRRAHRDDLALGRAALATFAALEVRTRAGLGLPEPVAAELRDAGDHLQVVVLTPFVHDPQPALARLAESLVHHAPADEGPVTGLLDAWIDVPPTSLEEARTHLLHAVATALAQTRHALVRARQVGADARRRDRFGAALAGLEAASPPPSGKGVVGLDLEGQPLLVQGSSTVITWARPGAPPDIVWDDEDGLDVPAARRLIRIRGSAPASARLAEAHQADPAYADHVARWLAAALELRALRKLLEVTRER